MADIVMPRLSDSMEEGTILQWLKQVGDEVAVGDELVEIETDKANMAYEADVAGTLLEILADGGETVPPESRTSSGEVARGCSRTRPGSRTACRARSRAPASRARPGSTGSPSRSSRPAART